jgi:hypothetical protein
VLLVPHCNLISESERRFRRMLQNRGEWSRLKTVKNLVKMEKILVRMEKMEKMEKFTRFWRKI